MEGKIDKSRIVNGLLHSQTHTAMKFLDCREQRRPKLITHNDFGRIPKF